MMKSLPVKGQAFTLVELLVIVALIGILAVLLLPVMSKMQGQAQGAACLSNLKQLAAGCILYSSENDGGLVPICSGTGTDDARTWRLLIAPYVGSDPKVFRCPSDKTAWKEKFDKTRGTHPASYGLNFTKQNIGGYVISQLHEYFGARAGTKNPAVLKPAHTILLADIGRVSNPSDSPEKWIERQPRGANYGYARFPGDVGFTGSDAWNVFPRHGKKWANAAFCDGHVAPVDVASEIVAHPPGDELCIFDNL